MGVSSRWRMPSWQDSGRMTATWRTRLRTPRAVHALADRAGDTETSNRALRTIAMAEALAGQPDGLDSSSKTLR